MNFRLNNTVTDRDHIQGPKTALLELVEYGDYQCPSCGQSYLAIREARRQLGEKLKFVFRNFPLSEHPDAFGAAMAAEAAALQNKFWEMHDLLFNNQAHLDQDDLLAYAEVLGLEMDLFRNDMQNEVLSCKIESDFEGGIKSGVKGTPSFYINGSKYDGDWERDALAQDLQHLLIIG